MRMMPLLVVVVCTLGALAACRSSERTETYQGPAPKVVEERPRPATPQTTETPDEYGARVTSTDGTKIAFDTAGDGPPLIIVSGALSQRAALINDPLVAALAKHFTVYIYDRRGRGQSTDTLPYAVDREIEDLGALVDHAGDSAYLFGVSSGAALALQAAAKLGPTKVTRLALYEPPYGQPAAAFATQKQKVSELVETGEPGDAASYFLTAIGTPPEALEDMKRTAPWEGMKKIDFTLAYDYAVLGDGAVPAATARAVTVPTLVIDGEKTMPFIGPAADRLAELMPRARRETLAGQTHQVNADATAPLLVDFFTAPAR
jgi:pimeloyl-ACP methyl ester carboxylesterase